MRILRSRRLVTALLTALAAVLALVAPAASVAAPVDIASAAAAVEPAVVQVTTKIDYQQAIGTGTGMVIDPGGVVLTNYHVVAGANTITGTVGGRDYPVVQAVVLLSALSYMMSTLLVDIVYAWLDPRISYASGGR